jgi:hypothetical protein
MDEIIECGSIDSLILYTWACDLLIVKTGESIWTLRYDGEKTSLVNNLTQVDQNGSYTMIVYDHDKVLCDRRLKPEYVWRDN